MTSPEGAPFPPPPPVRPPVPDPLSTGEAAPPLRPGAPGPEATVDIPEVTPLRLRVAQRLGDIATGAGERIRLRRADAGARRYDRRAARAERRSQKSNDNAMKLENEARDLISNPAPPSKTDAQIRDSKKAFKRYYKLQKKADQADKHYYPYAAMSGDPGKTHRFGRTKATRQHQRSLRRQAASAYNTNKWEDPQNTDKAIGLWNRSTVEVVHHSHATSKRKHHLDHLRHEVSASRKRIGQLNEEHAIEAFDARTQAARDTRARATKQRETARERYLRSVSARGEAGGQRLSARIVERQRRERLEQRREQRVRDEAARTARRAARTRPGGRGRGSSRP